MMAVGAPQFAMGRLILWSVSWVLLLHSYCGAANEGDACPGGCVCRSRWDCATAPQPALLSPACCGPGLMCCPLTRVSQLKCEEYSRLVYAGTPDFSWLRSVLPEAEWPLLASRLPTCPLAALPLVVGGEEAVPGEIPHMALLGYGDPEDGLWLCGGALVSERWVLTAAHCLHGYRGPTRRVRLGTWVEGVPEGEDAQQVEVSARVPHPLYRPPVRYHDIGLLLLAARPVLSPAVRPACLHTEFAIPADKAQACGYGKVAFDADGAGDALRYVWLPLVTRVQCAPRYKDEMGTATLPRGLPRSLLCAGDPRGGKDTCQGDSGGPLQIISDVPHCTYSLVGVTSFGKFCGFPESPGVYTRVSHYVPWIESIVWPREVQAASSAAHPAYPTTSDDLPHAVVKPAGIAWTVPLSLLGEGENSTGSSPIVDVTSQQVQM